MRGRGAGRGRGKGSTASGFNVINAAALQDHLARALRMPTMRSRSSPVTTNSRKAQSQKKATPQREMSVEEQLDRRLGLRIDNEPTEEVRPQLTLAQRRGLAPAPPPKLTAEQWKETKAVALTRSCDGDCPICMEPLGADDQVILSCSHVFHKICLGSFERFSQSKICPLCRREAYEKKLFPEGRLRHYHDCAIKIQSCFRVMLARRIFAKLQETIPPKDPRRREKFFQNKFSRIADTYLKEAEDREDEIDKLFLEIDQSLAKTRKIFGRKPQPRKHQLVEDEDWRVAAERAKMRGDPDCAICLQALAGKEGSLLSCSHYFHAQCLAALEAFTAATPVHHCPICREIYRKKNVHLFS